MKKNYTLLLLAFLTSYISGFSQEILPKDFTEVEKSIITDFQFRNSAVSTPPDGSVRTAAEWEEIEYLVIRWTSGFNDILLQIVQATVEECKVLIATQNQSAVASYLNSNGVDMSQVEFLNAPSNSIWIRDYAANTVYFDDVGERALVDWIYNRPRPLDNELPVFHADFVDAPIFRTNSGSNDLVNTGGNFMSDGLGTAFASKLILEENQAGNTYGVTPKTEAQIDAIMNQYMGINTYIKMDQVPYDPIDHIDMHMKLLDEQTILVSRYPTGVADGPQIEQNIDYVISNFQTPFGTEYKIEWIDAPPSSGGNFPDSGGLYRTYTNSVFVNKTIIVPTYRPEVDGPALQQYQELLPGYTVVGIDVDNQGQNLIGQGGAIHCITHAIGVSDPLLIVHQPIEASNTTFDIPISAMVKHNSGISQAQVYWRESGTEEYSTEIMTFVDNDIWETALTVPSSAEEIEYYIWAEANSGKSITRPIVAPDGYWTFPITNLSSEEWAAHHISNPYPNPTRDVVNFNLNNIPGEIQIKIHNLLGQELYNTKIFNGNGQVSLQLNPQWNGTLFVSFEGEFGRVTKKVIKI